jgi:hypothetical protein
MDCWLLCLQKFAFHYRFSWVGKQHAPIHKRKLPSSLVCSRIHALVGSMQVVYVTLDNIDGQHKELGFKFTKIPKTNFITKELCVLCFIINLQEQDKNDFVHQQSKGHCYLTIA